MTVLPALAAALALAAAFAGLPRRAPSPTTGSRVLSILAAMAMVPSLDQVARWPAAALVGGAALLATPIPCLLAAAAALTAALPAPAGEREAPIALVLAAASLVAVGASFDTVVGVRLRSGVDRAWLAGASGIGLCLALAFLGEGQVPVWRVAFAAGTERVTLPGTGLVAGWTLLIVLGGSLALLAHLMTPAVPSLPIRQAGQKLLVLGTGLAVLSLGHLLYRGAPFPEALGAGSRGLSAVLLAAAALVGSLQVLLGDAVAGETGPWVERAAKEARVGAALVAGIEGWLRGGSYATSTAGSAAAAALLALAVLERTKMSLLRKGLLMAALASVLVA